MTANMHYGFGWRNTVTAFVIEDGPIINVLEEKQGSWWEYQDSLYELFSSSSFLRRYSRQLDE